MRQDNVRMQVSDPKLNNKIRASIKDSDGPIYWYIKFNLKLDPNSINSNTMYVTDLGGYVLNTYIDYDTEKNLISITPLDEYEQEYYYLLHITTGVRSEKGTRLKKQVNILFKLLDDKISEHEILKDSQLPPEPKKRPKNYDAYKVKPKVYGLDQSIYESLERDKLPLDNAELNPLLGIMGIIILFISVFTKNIPFIITAMVIALFGVYSIVRQLLKPSFRAVNQYNKGVKKFNKGEYEEAKVFFKKAWAYDEYNEMIEYALQKVEYFL